MNSNHTFASLVIDPDYEKTEKNIAYGVPIFLLFYLLLVPAILLCWYTITNIMRSRGLINQRDAENIMHELEEIPIITNCKK